MVERLLVDQEQMMANQRRTDAHLGEVREKIDYMRTELKDGLKEIIACQRNMETSLEEEKPISEDTKPEAAQRQAPKEDAEMMPKKRRRDRKLATERRGTPKERTGMGAGRNVLPAAEG
jgi:hypothetical protein